MCMIRTGLWVLLQLQAPGPVQTGPGRLAVPFQMLPSNGSEMLSSQEKRGSPGQSYQFTLFLFVC